MKRKPHMLTAVLAAVVLAAFSQISAFSQSTKPVEVTLKGEVVDLHCYLTRGAKGADHAGCSNACISRGVSPGFLSEEGKLYLLLDEKPFSAKDKVAGLAGQQVTLTGTVVERDGVRGLLIKIIERAGS
jgi:hypothetical protein